MSEGTLNWTIWFVDWEWKIYQWSIKYLPSPPIWTIISRIWLPSLEFDFEYSNLEKTKRIKVEGSEVLWGKFTFSEPGFIFWEVAGK